MAEQSKLIADYYQQDPQPDLSALSGDARYVGAIIKASEGLYYQGKGWFSDVWAAIRSQGRYGDDWFRGGYHFLKFDQDGEQQADYYLQTVEDAGGWDEGRPLADRRCGTGIGFELQSQNSRFGSTPATAPGFWPTIRRNRRTARRSITARWS